MASREIVLWLDERWYDALERNIHGETVQDKLEEYLDGLIDNLIPEDEFERINKEIYTERMEQDAAREAARRFAVFRVTEHGQQNCFLVDEPVNFLVAARSLRSYVRSGSDAGFRNYYAATQEITGQEFTQYARDRYEGIERVVGAFDIDLDAGTFTELEAERGWYRYSVKDVCAAAYHADRRKHELPELRLSYLNAYLKGRELSPPQEHLTQENLLLGTRRLRPKDISFADEISEMDGKLDFYVESFGGIDEVFGTHVCTTENDDYLNIYADYDMERGEVADTLTVILHCGDGSDVECAYQLSAEEKAMLLPKMEAYCQQRDGMSLSERRDQHLAEQRQEQRGSPSMTLEQTM